jgi:serine/threonine protein kinase
MIDEDFNAKLVDFGLAKEFSLTEDHFFDTFCGSPSYTSP